MEGQNQYISLFPSFRQKRPIRGKQLKSVKTVILAVFHEIVLFSVKKGPKTWVNQAKTSTDGSDEALTGPGLYPIFPYC